MNDFTDLKKNIASYFHFMNGYYDGQYPIYEHNASIFRLDGEMGVMFDIDESQEINETFNAISLRTSSFSTNDGAPVHKLILSTRRTEFEFLEKFSTICAEFVDYGENGEKREKITKDPFKWYKSWGEVMGTKAAKRIPTAVLAEMMVLDYLILNGESPSWEGTSKGIVDIRTKNRDYEVKSSISRDSNTIHVSSEHQLHSEEKPLNLIYCCYQESEFGVSIDDMAKRLVMNGFEKDVLEDNLSSLGYDVGKVARYEKYILVKMWDFEINESFPKIDSSSFINGTLPFGITTIEYTIELSGIPHNEINYQANTPSLKIDDYKAPREWAMGKIRNGTKTLKELYDLECNDYFFEFFSEIDNWPKDTKNKWKNIIDEIASYVLHKKQDNWNYYVKNISSNLNLEILKSNCDLIVGDIEKNSVTDKCVRIMVKAPYGTDSIDSMHGIMMKCADLGWNVFVVAVDNYEIGSKQIIDRISTNLKGINGFHTWRLINLDESKLDEYDSNLLNLNNLDRTKYIITCFRNQFVLSKIYNWLTSYDGIEKMKLLILDHRSEIQTNVVRGYYKGLFHTDDLVDRLSNYTTRIGDGDHNFGKLTYVSFVSSAFQLFMNDNHVQKNPIDSLYEIKPLRNYFGPSQLFSKNGCPILIGTDADTELVQYYSGYLKNMPETLKDSICWFICASAIAELMGVNWTPCMIVLVDRVEDHAIILKQEISTYLLSEQNELMERCKKTYEKLCKPLDGKQFNRLYPSNEDFIKYPAYDEITSIVHKYIHSINSIDVHLDDKDSTNTEYDILKQPTIVINNGSLLRLTETSCVVSSYYAHTYGSNNWAIHHGPWFGNLNNCVHLERIWIPKRFIEHFIKIEGCEELIMETSKNNMKNTFNLINRPEISEMVLDACNKFNRYEKCAFEPIICTICGNTISPGTIYHLTQNRGEPRCLTCHREHADEHLTKVYGYISTSKQKIIDKLLKNNSVPRDEFDIITGSKFKTSNVIDILKMDGYRFDIHRDGSLSLIMIPEVEHFLNDLNNDIDTEEMYMRYESTWKWIYKYLLKETISDPRYDTTNDYELFIECIEKLKNNNGMEYIYNEFSDISNNDYVYDKACSIVRTNVFSTIMMNVLSNCEDVIILGNNDIEYRGEILKLEFYLSEDDIPEECDEDISILISDEILIITNDCIAPFSEFFTYAEEYDGYLEYVIRLKESGF